ncbi:MAG: hypothetical protein AB1714_17760 [Acidobacteriota bacterium]
MLKRLLDDYPVRSKQCDILHYVQTVTEKISKALTTPPGSPDPPQMVHRAFLDFIRRARTNMQLQRVCGFGGHRQYGQYLQSLDAIAREIEDLMPIKDRYHANPEYPWEIKASHRVIAPSEHYFGDLWNPASPKMRKLRTFIESCIDIL